MVSLEEMRKQYDIAELNQNDLLESPTDMFRNWFEKIEDLEQIEQLSYLLLLRKENRPVELCW